MIQSNSDTVLGKGPKINGHFMVFDHNWGGGGRGSHISHFVYFNVMGFTYDCVLVQ